MISHWEEFKPGPTPKLEERLHATLSRKGLIFLNGNIHELMGGPDAVVLLFDKINSVIGLNPVSPNVSNAFRLKPKPPGRHRIIHASPFCRHYGIAVDNTTVFLNPQIDEDGVLRLDLKATTRARRHKMKIGDRTK